ncbi:hypothetical protein, partial [Streptococcus pneumoniae]|uniref:hypothetical protein n=1 Tax=Streptococcus pneumoniae TaxID=1313 RepID=UPI001C626F0A
AEHDGKLTLLRVDPAGPNGSLIGEKRSGLVQASSFFLFRLNEKNRATSEASRRWLKTQF